MLCYRCGSHVPDDAESCTTCGQKLAGGGVRQATATFSRRRLQGSQIENAPYKAGDVLSNRYEIKDIVGVGPVGFVFRAKDREADVEVAVKVINPRLVQTTDERKQFARVMRLGRKLSHQNLLRVYEEGEDQDRPYCTMQFLEGLTLRKIIDLRTQKGEFFGLKEIEPILGQVASALDGAHKVGPHSNLKPDNIIVLPDLLKVADFGLGLAIPRLPFVQAARQRKADRYLAPEYVQGGEVDQRADIYALGVIVGEMLTGLTPDGAIPELARRNPEVPPQLEGLYRRALNSNPLARPKTATEFFDEFTEIVRRASPPPLRQRPEAASQPAVPRSRPPPPVPAIAGAGVTVEVRKSRPNLAEKPPPPVPDTEVESPDVPLNGSPAQVLPPDTTQPINGSDLTIPPPPPKEDPEVTQVVPSFPGGVPSPELIGEPTQSRQFSVQGKRSGAGVWFFVVFTLAGLSLGAAGGYWLLQRTRQPPNQVTQFVTPPEPPKPNPEPVKDEARAPEPIGLAANSNPEKGAGSTVETGAAQPAVDPRAAESQKKVEEARAAEEKRKAEKDARLAELKRKEEEEEHRKEEEAARLAEERRLEEERRAEEKKKEEEKRLAEEKRREEEEKSKVVAAAGTAKSECPSGMKLIPSGSFKMGTARDDPMMGFDEKILTSVSVPAFCIDIYEYPNVRGSMPKVGVSWNDAKKLCETRGKRLCTEEEWEKACKGPGNARYPYGNTYDAEACNTEDELGEDRPLAASGRFQKCRSGYGIADMSGNAAEWTASAYAGGADKAQKGGSFSKPDYAARCSARKSAPPTSRPNDVGFRCCSDL